jgi:GT2 family glycosyltransferase
MSPLPVSLLIVNYHVYDDLDRCLAAVDRALRTGDEVIVLDQASDEARRAAVEARHPHVRWIVSRDNVGFAAGVNRAAAAARTPRLLWLNPDAIISAPVVETLDAWLTSHPETGCVGPRVVDEDGRVQASARRFPDPTTAIAGRSTWLTRHFPNNWLTRHNLPARTADRPQTVDWLAGSCLLTRRDLFERLGGLDEGFFLYWEDADYCRRAAALGFGCTYLPTVSVQHAVGRSAALNPATAIRAFHASAYRMFAKHAGPMGRVVAPLVRLALWTRGETLARAALRRIGRAQAPSR